MFITYSKDTLNGDKFAQETVHAFFSAYLDKFCSKFTLKDLALEDLKSANFNNIRENKTEYTSSVARGLSTKECMDLCQELADFAQEYKRSIDINAYVENYLPEWRGVFEEESKAYPIAQYNAMQLSSLFCDLISYFTRSQIYSVYSTACTRYHEEKGSECYVISMSGIEQFGLSNPHPRFVGQIEDKREGELTTRQPDIGILAPLLNQYKIIPFNMESGVSLYSGYAHNRILEALSCLKYTHLNVGKVKRRQVLDIKAKQVQHIETLDDKAVTGKRWW